MILNQLKNISNKLEMDVDYKPTNFEFPYARELNNTPLSKFTNGDKDSLEVLKVEFLKGKGEEILNNILKSIPTAETYKEIEKNFSK